MKPTKKTMNHSPEDRVLLKPVLGIPPLVYVPIGYGLLGFFFLTFLFLQCSNPANIRVKIESTPHTIAVYVDDRYLGVTPLTTKITNEPHTLTLNSRGYAPHTIEIAKKNILQNLFATKLSFHMSIDEPDYLIEQTIRDLAGYTNLTTLRKFPIPDILPNKITALESALKVEENTEQREEIFSVIVQILYYSLPYLQDATALIPRMQRVLTQYSTLITTIQHRPLTQLSKSFATNQENRTLLAELIERLQTYILTAQDGNTTTTTELTVQPEEDRLQQDNPSIISVLDMNFVLIPPSTLNYQLYSIQEAGASPLPLLEFSSAIRQTSNTTDAQQYRVNTDAFYVLDHEVSFREYQNFIENQSEWKKTSQQLVSDDHSALHSQVLSGDYAGKWSLGDSVRNITWYDAQAYCSWINAKLLAQNLPYTARLPNEFEWRAAQQYIEQLDIQTLTLTQQNSIQRIQQTMHGSLWEWTENWYSPLPQFAQSFTPPIGIEKIILGGSDVSSSFPSRNVLIHYSRNASQRPDWATDYLGFRIILIVQNNG